MGNTVNILLKPLEAYLYQAHLRGAYLREGSHYFNLSKTGHHTVFKTNFNLSKTGHHTVFKTNLNFQHIIQSTLPD